MSLAIEMSGISKFFPSTMVHANQGVDFSVEKGEVHALVGENGAGKTTLMNILYGLVQADRGNVKINGKSVHITHPRDAIENGIGMVHQHFKLVASFTVAQNILLGMEPSKPGFLRPGQENINVASLAQTYGLPVDPAAKVGTLPVGMQQRVEILKTLQRDAQILLLDEPTAVLTPQEVSELFDVIRDLAKRGRTIILITHKLPEVMAVADRVTAMRQGKVVGIRRVSETSVSELALMMVGREVLFTAQRQPASPGEIVLEADNLVATGPSNAPAVLGFSFRLHTGEILGIAGVNGNGQTELVETLTGLRIAEGGKIRLLGKDITHVSIGDRRALGLAHIPEDRMGMGLNLGATLDENIIVSRYRQPEFSRWGFMITSAMRRLSNQIIQRFAVASAATGEGISTLSGGNLQKIVLGRELSGEPKVIVANQPTRGLDVGSIEFVHSTLVSARDQGAGILLVSADLDEIMALSDRVLVMYRGRIAGELTSKSIDEKKLGILMAGGKLDDIIREGKSHAIKA